VIEAGKTGSSANSIQLDQFAIVCTECPPDQYRER